MVRIKVFAFIGFLIVSLTSFAEDSLSSNTNNANVDAGSYHINVVLPEYMNWTLYKDNKDASGYTKIYLPRKANNISEQNITVTYDSSNQNSLRDDMQQVLDALDKTDCQVTNHKVLEKLKNHITFVVNLDQCADNKSITQIFKIYNTDDGQYSITYSADTLAVDYDLINKMQNVILSSRLIAR